VIPTMRRRRIPRVLQHDVTDCGAACLSSIVRHYGLRFPIARIRQLAATDRKGTNVLGLVQAASHLGLSAKGVKGTVESLPKVPLPAVAHVVTSTGLHHFVVLYDVTASRVVVMDPADGRVHRIRTDDFAREWTGVLVLLVPGETFRGGEASSPIGQRLLAILRPHRSALAQAFVGALVYTILGLSTAVFVQKLVDHVLVDGNLNLLNLLGAGMIVLAFVQLFIGAAKDFITLRTGQRIDASIVLGYYQHLLALPQRFFDTMRVGELVSRVNDAVKIRAFVNDVALNLLVNMLIVAFSFGLMFTYSAKLAFIMVTMVPVYGAIYWLTNRVNRETQRRLMESSADLESQLVESIGNVATLKRFNLECAAAMDTEVRFVRLLRNVYRSGAANTLSRNASDSAARIFTVLLLWVGGIFVIQRVITPGELMSFYALAGYLSAPVIALVGANRTLQDALIAGDRLFEIMDLEPEPRGGELELTAARLGDIRFEGVCFRYGTRARIFDGLDLTIGRGEVTAVVGESGSGKSTLVSLLHNLYPLESGTIRIGERDVRHYSTESLRRMVGVVPQDLHFFAGTVLSNIAVGNGDPDMERVLALCDLLGITQLIEELPGGFHAPIGEDGVTLSGGQRQRIAIARALYGDPEVLILDEATSSLDPSSEEGVRKAIRHLRANGKTVVIVAHRLSTIADADRVVLMEAGRVVEEGAHQELIVRGGPYARHWSVRYAADRTSIAIAAPAEQA
jgi:ATP-binding cassette, subfamily C, bacteriocin exporter